MVESPSMSDRPFGCPPDKVVPVSPAVNKAVDNWILIGTVVAAVVEQIKVQKTA